MPPVEATQVAPAASELAPIPSPPRPTSITLPGVPSTLDFPQGVIFISVSRRLSPVGHSSTQGTLMHIRNQHRLGGPMITSLLPLDCRREPGTCLALMALASDAWARFQAPFQPPLRGKLL